MASDESEFIAHKPCPVCGSSDALARYSDGHGYCFSCDAYLRADGDTVGPTAPNSRSRPMKDKSLLGGEYTPLTKRRITLDTVRKYQYMTGSLNSKGCHIANYHDEAGSLVAQKLRFANKKDGMPWRGEPKDATLFGAHLWGKGKRIVITEGEIDCLSVAQVFGLKWPVVSLKNGADKTGKGAAKEIAANLEYLSRFDEIVLMFDMDEPGIASAQAAAAVLPPGRVKIASLPMKDANECLVAGKADDIMQAVWNARPYKPECLVAGEDVWEPFESDDDSDTSLPYPDIFPKMNELVWGIRLGELDIWTSGTGMGKTTLIKTLQLHYFQTTNLNQALIHLEEPVRDTARTLVGMHLGQRLDVPNAKEITSAEERRRGFEDVFLAKDAAGNPRFQIYDAFGAVEDDDLYAQVRFLAQSCGCRIIWIDHLSILVSSMGEDGDERRRIDAIVHNLKLLTVELGVYIGLVVHLRKSTRTEASSFEEGGVATLDDLRGSAGIKQLANSVFTISRNQQAETEDERSRARLHVLKCRKTGRTGPADFYRFNQTTGRLEPTDAPTSGEEYGFTSQVAATGEPGEVPTIPDF